MSSGMLLFELSALNTCHSLRHNLVAAAAVGELCFECSKCLRAHSQTCVCIMENGGCYERENKKTKKRARAGLCHNESLKTKTINKIVLLDIDFFLVFARKKGLLGL